MKKHGNQKCVSLNEALVEKWKKRFILEKGYSEELSEWLARSLAKLIDHMQYGYALIAFHTAVPGRSPAPNDTGLA